MYMYYLPVTTWLAHGSNSNLIKNIVHFTFSLIYILHLVSCHLITTKNSHIARHLFCIGMHKISLMSWYMQNLVVILSSLNYSDDNGPISHYYSHRVTVRCRDYQLHACWYAGFRIHRNAYNEIYFCLDEAINPYIEQILTTQGSTLSFLAGCPKSHFLGWYRNFFVYWHLKLDNQVVNSTCPKDRLGWIWLADDP